MAARAMMCSSSTTKMREMVGAEPLLLKRRAVPPIQTNALIHALGNVTHGEPGLVVIGDLHEFKLILWHAGLCGRASAKLYSVYKSILILVETFIIPVSPVSITLTMSSWANFLEMLMATKCISESRHSLTQGAFAALSIFGQGECRNGRLWGADGPNSECEQK